MGQDPDAIRQEIEQTRERMGDTVDALGYKADVPARAKESISDKVDTVKSKFAGIGSGVSAATPQPQDVKHAPRWASCRRIRSASRSARQPSAFLPACSSPAAESRMSASAPSPTRSKSRLVQTGQEALEHGKQVAQETATVATQKAQESGQAHAQEMSDSAKQSVAQVEQTAKRQG